jgi:dCMP deaminase
MKRQTYISWDDYFVGIALLSALRSKDPHRKSGACIVNTAKRIVGIGYNGFPHGCIDSVVPWTAEQTVPWLHTKQPYEVPAEINAVLNRCGDTQGSSIYVAHFPCKFFSKLRNFSLKKSKTGMERFSTSLYSPVTAKVMSVQK